VRRFLVPTLVAVSLSGLLVACGDDGSSGPESGLDGDTAEQSPVPSPYRDPTPVIEAINEEVGGPNGQTRVTDIGIYEGYAVFEAQDPDMPRNLDRYYFDGEFDPPDPVMTSASGPDETELFSVGEVNWPAIPGLMETALAEVDVEGAMATNALVFRISGEITIQISVTGTRNSGTLRADAQGNVTEVLLS
jgi:hypothetical protein